VNTEEPIVSRIYPVALSHRAEVRRQLQQMLEWGIIRPSSSCHLNPLLVVSKADKSLRICIDFRLLNSKTKFQQTRPLEVQEILQRFHGVKYFAQIDLTQGFLQIPLTKASKQFTCQRWVDTMKTYGIKVPHAPPYHPKATLVERAHAELHRLFRVFCSRNHATWSNHLPYVVVVLNYTVSENLSYTPAELFLGSTGCNQILEHFGIHAGERETWRDKLIYAASNNQERKRKRNRALEKKGPKVKEGKLVFLRLHKLSSQADNLVRKFFALYSGPYYVKKQVGANAYVLIDCTTGKETPAQHVENLRLWNCSPEKLEEWTSRIKDKTS